MKCNWRLKMPSRVHSRLLIKIKNITKLNLYPESNLNKEDFLIMKQYDKLNVLYEFSVIMNYKKGLKKY